MALGLDHAPQGGAGPSAIEPSYRSLVGFNSKVERVYRGDSDREP